jgi:hypothetical protein
MEAICSSETSVDLTRGYISEDITLHKHRYENLKSYTGYILFIIPYSESPVLNTKVYET